MSSEKGITFWYKDKKSPKEHLYFIISDPAEDNTVLVVNMTTFYNTGKEDSSCILQEGEHPAIKQKSYITYHNAFAVDISVILTNIAQKQILSSERLSPTCLKKIQYGAMNSDYLPEKLQKYFDYF